MNDTIVGIATLSFNVGISIIRISGNLAPSILSRVFRFYNKNKNVNNLKPNTVSFGHIIDNNEIVDEAIVIYMKAPYSYTCEDVVEIQCHGGVLITNKIFNLIVKNGARIAEPGEFTKRAFLNGRIDLSKAEAVMDVITAKSDMELDNAVKQMNGMLYRKIILIREEILHHIAYIEAALDDPEQLDVDKGILEIKENINKHLETINSLIDSYDNGKLIKEGVKTAIVGSTNVGKSTLLNFLVGQDKAIVSDVHGTTRDVIEETINIKGITLNILDTAGIRKTDDIVENIGIKKSKDAIEQADFIIFLLDSSRMFNDDEKEIYEKVKNKNTLYILNKIDNKIEKEDNYLNIIKKENIIEVSLKEYINTDEIVDKIFEKLNSKQMTINDEVIITKLRHKNELVKAKNAINNVINGINEMVSEDLLTIDLTDAYVALGKIIGEEIEDDIVNKIFSEFCMGK